CDFGAEVRKIDRAPAPVLGPQMHPLPPDVHADHLLPAERGHHRLALAWELAPRVEIRLVLVREAAHQAAAAPRDLGGVEREPLVLRELQAHGLELPQPRRAAELAPAPPDAAEQRRLVADADLSQLDPGAEGACQITDQLPEIDPALRGEVDRQLVPVELPLRLGDLHLEAEVLDPLAGEPA